MKKNIASIENETTKATTFAPRNVRERKNVKSTIGTRARISMTTKPVSATAATANSARMPGEPQPHWLPSTSASTSAVRPVVIVAMPGMSTVLLDGLVARLAGGAQRHGDGDRRDRQVEEEDGPPAHGLGEEAADHGADGQRQRGHAGPRADRLAALMQAGTRW